MHETSVIRESVCDGCGGSWNTLYLQRCQRCEPCTCTKHYCPHCRNEGVGIALCNDDSKKPFPKLNFTGDKTEPILHGIDLSKDRDYFAIVRVKNGKVERIINARDVDWADVVDKSGMF